MKIALRESATYYGLNATKWWTDFNGPQELIKRITDNLSQNKVIIINNNNIFWINKMYEILDEHLMENLNIERITIDLNEINFSMSEPIESHIVTITEKDSDQIYLTSLKLTKGAFIKKFRRLKNKLLWFKVNNSFQQNKLIEFLSTYKVFSSDNGYFGWIKEKNIDWEENKNFSNIIIEPATDINDYNIQLLINNLVLTKKSNLFNPSYLSSLYFYLSQKNPQKAAYLINKIDFGEIDPLDLPFEELEYHDNTNYQRSILEAQIISFFPKIEFFRLYLIEKYGQNLSALIQDKAFNTKTNEEILLLNYEKKPFESIYDIDLGDLFFFSKLKKVDNHQKELIQYSTKDLSFLVEFRNIRNLLAHSNPLTLKQVKRFVEIDSQFNRLK